MPVDAKLDELTNGSLASATGAQDLRNGLAQLKAGEIYQTVSPSRSHSASVATLWFMV